MRPEISVIEYTKENRSPRAKLALDFSLQKYANMRKQTPQEHRESQQKLAEVRPLSSHIRTTDMVIAGVKCELLENKRLDKDRRIIIYIHGGSWMFGNMDSSRPVGAMLVGETSFKVLMVDYRLAPEHPYPAGFEDCYNVYKAVLAEGYKPHQIGLFGDSAGGNLSLALINRLKEEKLPLPSCVGLASPVTDMRDESFTFRSIDDLAYTTINGNEQSIFSVYLEGEHFNQRNLPTISPITADLSGLPPVLIHSAEDELVTKDNIAYAEKMAAYGGDVRLKIWRGMFHDFTVVGHTLKESRESLEEFGLFFLQNVKPI